MMSTRPATIERHHGIVSSIIVEPCVGGGGGVNTRLRSPPPLARALEVRSKTQEERDKVGCGDSAAGHWSPPHHPSL